MIHKVTAYILRRKFDISQLLVFRHDCGIVEFPLQVPAGTVEENEDFEVAARREIAEESGLHDLSLIRWLGSRNTFRDDLGDTEERHFFLYLAPESIPDSWEHPVSGTGEDSGMVFPYSWIDSTEVGKIVSLLSSCMTPELLPELFCSDALYGLLL